MNDKQLRAELDAVYRSTSWRITAPLRALSSLARRASFAFRAPKQAARRLLQKLASHPKLGAYGRRILLRFPTLKARIRQSLVAPSISKQSAISVDGKFDEGQLASLSPAAQQIYHQLRPIVVVQK
jgi:O-antigen chain-terminating methyltransferase